MIDAKKGSIVNVASVVGLRGVEYMSAYGAAKAGLINARSKHCGVWTVRKFERLRDFEVPSGDIERMLFLRGVTGIAEPWIAASSKHCLIISTVGKGLTAS